jgi:hypothetical protein
VAEDVVAEDVVEVCSPIVEATVPLVVFLCS